MGSPVGRGRTGLVFDIQRFSIHDGPGIRTTVFMKGCPLRCLWCANPESQQSLPNLVVNDVNCRRCGACGEVCSRGAIGYGAEGIRTIDRLRCNECLDCVAACVYESLTGCGRTMTVGETLAELSRDRDFYLDSGGGITVSGGEPLSQNEFVQELLRACRDSGFSTALDTSGYGPWDNLAALIPHLDLILFDIKHLDSGEHRKGTGVPNEIILDNLSAAARSVRIWLRVPLVAGYNDSESHIRGIAALARDVCAEKVSLLPYHEGGRSKCLQLGRRYPAPEAKAPSRDHVEFLRGLIVESGVSADVGS